MYEVRRLGLNRFDVDDALEKSGGDYLLVVSRPTASSHGRYPRSRPSPR
jgi:hypothetical protein